MSDEICNAHTLVLYDGVCVLCHGLVCFLLQRDRVDEFRFAALQSDLARRVLEGYGVNSAQLSTVCVVAGYGSAAEVLLVKSAAVLYAAARLGGVWKLASVGRVVPRVVRDWFYDIVARYRYRVFGRYDSCPLPRAEDRERFLG